MWRSIEYIKINKILSQTQRDMEYTVVSRGTEKAGSKGYIGITKIENNKSVSINFKKNPIKIKYNI